MQNELYEGKIILNLIRDICFLFYCYLKFKDMGGAGSSSGKYIFIDEARLAFQKENGDVDWNLVKQRWAELKGIKESLAAKFYTDEVHRKAQTLSQGDQKRLLDIMMGGLCNSDSSVGVYATRPEDYDVFNFYL